MERKIDINTWSRKAQWEHFSKLDFPFYHVSFYIDVTPVRGFAKLHGYSFYHTLCYLVTKSLNSVENFRYRIRGNEVWLIEESHPSFTILRRDCADFQILSCRMQASIEEFCERAAALYAQVYRDGGKHPEFLNGDNLGDEACYLSCLPWIDASCISSERSLDVNDSIPRVAWGKYISMDRSEPVKPDLNLWNERKNHKRRQGQRLWINMTVDVNHRLVDGYHIGLFAERLQEAIDQL